LVLSAATAAEDKSLREADMKNFLWVLAMLALWAPAVQAGEPTDYKIKHHQMLYTTVLLSAGVGTGSGTVIFSGEVEVDGKIEVHTLILTNHHVIKQSIHIKEEWDPQAKKEKKTETRDLVEAFWFEYNDYSIMVGKTGRRAEIIAYDANADLAVVRLIDTERFVKNVAKLMPLKDRLHQFEKVYAVGAGLGFPPFSTDGTVGFNDGLWKGNRYVLTTAPIIFGNSGGALFRWSDIRNSYELVGVPSAVSNAGFATGGPVAHMAWSIPIETVYKVLESNFLCHVWTDPCPAKKDKKLLPN
jgi:S1-C subfamily serine protease